MKQLLFQAVCFAGISGIGWLSGRKLIRFSAMAAKIVVTPVTMTLNIFVVKLLVEKL